LINYVAYRAYSKDAEYADNAEFARSYYQTFIAQIVGKANSEGVTNPNLNIKGDPNLN
jgi:hypothetical protein